jgi:hypothetical protein
MKNNSQAIKKVEEAPASETTLAEIIPFPSVRKISRRRKPRKARIAGTFLHYKGKKIPIAQFQKAGYDRLLRLLVKEIG